MNFAYEIHAFVYSCDQYLLAHVSQRRRSCSLMNWMHWLPDGQARGYLLAAIVMVVEV